HLDNAALLSRQRAQRRADSGGVFGFQGILVRTGAGGSIGGGVSLQVLDQPGAALAGAQAVDGAMPGYAQGPMEGRSEQRVERWGILPDLHKYVLDHFFGLADVAQNADSQRKERLGGQIVELNNGPCVFRRNSKQQLLLRLFFR